jgi:hypothetical protein
MIEFIAWGVLCFVIGCMAGWLLGKTVAIRSIMEAVHYAEGLRPGTASLLTRSIAAIR